MGCPHFFLDYATADPDLKLLTFLGLCNRGVQLSMRGYGALSTPMTTGDSDHLVNAFDETLGAMKAQRWF